MSDLHVGYIVSQFPCYDETFIAREMAAVRDTGVQITIFSIKKCYDKIIHRQAEELLPHLVVMPLLCSLAVWGAVLEMLFCRPFRFVKAFAEVFRHAAGSADFLLKAIVMFPLACAYAREAEKRGVTNIHAHWATHPASMALVISCLTKIPMSFTGHAHDIHVNTTGLAYKMRKAEFVLTCTAANKEYLLGLCPGLPQEKIIVSYHGLDAENIYVPRPEPLPGSPFRIVSVGSCLPCKGYDRLLAACDILRGRGIDFRLDIVGGGPLQGSLENMSVRMGLDGFVTFHGFMKQENMPPYYQGAHCFVLAAVPEIHWGIPNVVAEAMACGLPVVTTRLPALPELVDDGVSGILFDDPQPEELAGAFEKLAKDTACRESMGAAGRRRVCELFGQKKNARQVKDAFESVLCLRQGG